MFLWFQAMPWSFTLDQESRNTNTSLLWSQTWWKQPTWLCRKQSVRKAHQREKGTSIMQVLGFLLRVSQHLICPRTNCPKVCPRGATCLQFAMWDVCCFPGAEAEMTQGISKRAPLPPFPQLWSVVDHQTASLKETPRMDGRSHREQPKEWRSDL